MNEDTALFCDAFPVNPYPFLIALKESLEAGEPITTDKSRRILWTLVAILRGQFAKINLEGSARIQVHDLARMGRTTPLIACNSMLAEAEGKGGRDLLSEWRVSIISLIYFCWGDTGTLSLCDEWEKLHALYQQKQAA